MRRKNPFIYYGGKLAGFAVSVFVLSLAVFYIARLAPGDPLVSYYGDRAEKMTAEERAQAEEYRPQLTAYSLALSAILGKPINRQVLWFFATDTAVEL